MLKLMVIDDNTFDRKTIEQIVGSLSLVKWAGGFAKPQEALHEMMLHTPDVVIIAVELPEMNGLAFTSKLQAILPGIHVIVAAQSDHYAREAYDVGARGYLIKPFEKESLMKLLGNVRKANLME